MATLVKRCGTRYVSDSANEDTVQHLRRDALNILLSDHHEAHIPETQSVRLAAYQILRLC